MFKVLLLDIDGTIADTFPHLFDSFRYAVEPFLVKPPTDAEIVATFGPPEHECIASLLNAEPLAVPLGEAVETAVSRYHEHYEGGHDRVEAFAGIHELIQTASARDIGIAVFTGKGRRSAEFALKHLGLAEFVQFLVSGDDVARAKPDPEGVQQVLRRFGIRPEELLVVGDHPADIEAGNAVGAKTVAALWGAFDREKTLAAGPTWAFENVESLSHQLLTTTQQEKLT